MSDTERNRLAGYLRYSMSDAEREALNGLIDVVTADIEYDDRDLLEIRLLEAIEVLEERLSGESSCICGVIRMSLERAVGDHSAACEEEVAKPCTADVYSWTDLPPRIRQRFDDLKTEFKKDKPFSEDETFAEHFGHCLAMVEPRAHGLASEMISRLRHALTAREKHSAATV